MGFIPLLTLNPCYNLLVFVEKIDQLIEKQARLAAQKPFPLELEKNLKDWFRVELTYTSNAIEGNTLSRQETALIVDEGITVEGKSITEHLEAVNHAEALSFVAELVNKRQKDLTESDIFELHQHLLKKIDDVNAGRYRTVAVRIAGSTVVMPNPVKVPELMNDFLIWLTSANSDPAVKIAADAHYRLVSIHPFVDGNGRTARLLMNLLLMQEGYPPALIRKEDRAKYLTSLEKAQLGGSMDDYYSVVYEAIERSLDVYLEALEAS